MNFYELYFFWNFLKNFFELYSKCFELHNCGGLVTTGILYEFSNALTNGTITDPIPFPKQHVRSDLLSAKSLSPLFVKLEQFVGQ